MSHQLAKMVLACCLTSACCGYVAVSAQTPGEAQDATTCVGTVIDATGEPIIGASVIVAGTGNGAATDLDGNFSLRGVALGATVRIASIGCKPIEVKWEGQPLAVTLHDDSQLLSEVVVTALGMKRDKKALGYAVTEVKGDELNGNIINPTNALQGKVAGVEINQSDGGMFGTSKILIRGASTLGANNQPIYVVDGIILDNAVHENSADWSGSNDDYGNELKNLNPADFESVSVLKGAAATALYGSRGLNGAIVITTKSGKGSKGFGVTVSQTFGIDRMTHAPKFQNLYGPGAMSGNISYADSPFNNLAFMVNSDGMNSVKYQMEKKQTSWGPRFDGSSVEYVDGRYLPYRAITDNYYDIYRTGFNSTTNVAVQGGGDSTNFYMSMGYKYAEGITTNNRFDRMNVMLKASHKLSGRVMIEGGVTFSNSKPQNALKNMGEYFANGVFARNYDVNFFKNRYRATHGGMVSTGWGDEYGNVPGMDVFWDLNMNNREQKETVVRPNLKLTVDILDWLKFTTEGSFNYYYVREEEKHHGSGYAGEGGYYGMAQTTKEQTNLNVNLNANKNYDDWEIHGFVRGEYYNSFMQYMGMNTNGGLIAYNKFFINNSVNTPSYSGYISGRKRMLSLAGQVGASWRDQIFVDVTGRNDWSSSLVYADGHGTYSYFYPSVSGSWLISNTFRNLPSWITFGKIRASWAQVGNDTEPYRINSAYILNSGLVGADRVTGAELPNTVYDRNLKPERKTSWEVGLDWRFFDSRLALDFTYYQENTKDQIMSIAVPSVSGITNQYVNAGNIQNRGVELGINATLFENRDWQWTAGMTYTSNRSKIVSLHENVADYIKLSGDPDYGNFRIGSVAKVGGAYGLLMSDSMAEIDEESGLTVLGWHDTYKGAYQWRSGKLQEIGDINPKFMGSFNTGLRWKDLSLNVALDGRFGGYVASFNGRYATANGFSESSLAYRDPEHGGVTWTSRWDNKTYHDGVIPEGIFRTGTTIKQPDGSYYTVGTGKYGSGETYQELMEKGIIDPTHANTWTAINNKWINSGNNMGVITPDAFHKLNYIALREISLGYTLPSNWASKIGARNLRVTATGHNLGYLLNSLPNKENPESVRGTAAHEFRIRNFDGVTASYTFTINATF